MVRGQAFFIAGAFALSCVLMGCPEEPEPTTPSGSDVVGADDEVSLPDGAEVGAPTDVEPSVTFPEASLGLACEDICEEIAAVCDDLSLVGGSEDACVDACIAQGTEDGAWLASFGCFAGACDPSCFGDTPLVPPAICADVCEALDACGQMAVFGVATGDLPMCEIKCAGVMTGHDGIAEAMDCYYEALVADCDTATLQGCIARAPSVGDCDAICEVAFQACPDPEADLYGVWAEQADCVTACAELPEVNLVNFSICLSMNDCADPTPCLGMPGSQSQGCIDACDAMAALCEDTPDALDAAACPHVCTVFQTLAGLGEGTDAGACVEALGSCPEDEIFGAVIGCATSTGGGGPTDDNGPVCELLVQCEIAPLIGGLGSTVSECVAALDLLQQLDDPTIDLLGQLACVEDTALSPADCDAAYACFGIDVVDPPGPSGDCEAACSDPYGAGEDPDDLCAPSTPLAIAWPTQGDCAAACDELSAGQVGPFSLCLSLAECADPTPCFDVPEQSSAACEDLCTGFQGLCEDSPTGILSPSFCPVFCEAYAALQGFSPSPLAGVCAEDIGVCPDSGSLYGALLGCAKGAEELAVYACATLAACDLLAGIWDGPTSEGLCVAEFSFQMQSFQLAEVLSCIQSAGGACGPAAGCLGLQCVPSCDGVTCTDDGCGGTCECGPGHACESGICVPVCEPVCTPGICGADGCGDTCPCAEGESCEAGICVPGCEPTCPAGSCGGDGCGGTCACGEGEVCEAGVCGPACVPECGSVECGNDGCGGSCGPCESGEVCDGGVCVPECFPTCGECGDDGCGGQCGTCDGGDVCVEGACVVPPLCGDMITCMLACKDAGGEDDVCAGECTAGGGEASLSLFLEIGGCIGANCGAAPDVETCLVTSCADTYGACMDDS